VSEVERDIARSVRELLEAHGRPKREVYLDLENVGLVLPEVVEYVIDYFRNKAIGHPAITHRPGWEAYEAVAEASEKIAKAIGASPSEVAFTHSGTEANNLAILGAAKANKKSGKKVVVSSVEHMSVLLPAEELEKTGFEVVKVPVDREGFVKPEALEGAVDRSTVLVSVALVNHEIGTVQRLKELVEVAKDRNPNVIFHTDAADALNKVEVSVERLGVDLATFSSHKVYAPRGAGALYVREGVKVERVVYGPLSSQVLWPGVENVPAIAAFGRAVELGQAKFDEHVSKMKRLRDALTRGIMERVPHVLLNGPKGDGRAPDNVNLSFLYCEGEALTIELSTYGVYVSSGSACTTRILEPSHVLLAIGRKREEAHGSLLMKVWPLHSEEDVEYVLEVLPKAVERIRGISVEKPEA